MLIKTKVTTTQEVEREIELPYFGTDSFCHYLAIFNEAHSVKVFDGKNYSNIETGNSQQFIRDTESFKKCAPGDFYKAYNSVFGMVLLPTYSNPILATYDNNLKATIID